MTARQTLPLLFVVMACARPGTTNTPTPESGSEAQVVTEQRTGASDKPDLTQHCDLSKYESPKSEDRQLLERMASECRAQDACVLACVKSGCGACVGGGCVHLCTDRGAPPDAPSYRWAAEAFASRSHPVCQTCSKP